MRYAPSDMRRAFYSQSFNAEAKQERLNNKFKLKTKKTKTLQLTSTNKNYNQQQETESKYFSQCGMGMFR